jgi:hypothetical protein
VNVGGSEILIIAVVALLLFGPSLLAFWLGYILGRKTGDDGSNSVGPEAEAGAESAAPLPPDHTGNTEEERRTDE